MLPKKICDSVTCLEKLVTVRADCKNSTCSDFYIEDLEGIDIDKLAQMAGLQQVSGVELAKDLIHAASLEMLGDIELLIGQGFSLTPTFGELCSECDFIQLYQPAGGIQIQNTINSGFSYLLINSLDILTNYTGSAVLVISDGKTSQEFTVQLEAGVIAPVLLNYTTQQKIVSIYFQDTTIQTAQVQCVRTSSGCGCGGAKNTAAMTSIRYSGYANSIASKTQYGFKACASVQCSSDALVCDLIQRMPKIFGLTLLYKVGQKTYSSSRMAVDRITPFTSENQDEKKRDMVLYYENLYKTRLNGKGVTKGISSIINGFLRQRIDKCVTCDANSLRGWATG